jgi:hypothetical protein
MADPAFLAAQGGTILIAFDSTLTDELGLFRNIFIQLPQQGFRRIIRVDRLSFEFLT